MKPLSGQDGAGISYRLLSLARPDGEKARLFQALSEAERRRGDRLLDQKKGEEFLVGRGLLRETLAGLLDMEPRLVEIAEGEFGKPYLPGQAGLAEGLRFNVSHAGGLFLVAVGRGRDVGVDLEEMRQDLAFRPMAERYFSLRERDELFGLEEGEQLSAFYRCWTRKEAYLKATGSGFSQPSTAFDVSLLPGEPPALLAHRGDPREAARWEIFDLEAGGGYCAALAAGTSSSG